MRDKARFIFPQTCSQIEQIQSGKLRRIALFPEGRQEAIRRSPPLQGPTYTIVSQAFPKKIHLCYFLNASATSVPGFSFMSSLPEVYP